MNIQITLSADGMEFSFNYNDGELRHKCGPAGIDLNLRLLRRELMRESNRRRGRIPPPPPPPPENVIINEASQRPRKEH